MRCPFCGRDDTRVIDSRLVSEGDQVRRRRECTACRERYTTYETAELALPRVVKQDGTRESFSEDKLRGGMTRALEKRPVDSDAVERSLQRLKRRAMAHGDREVPTRTLGDWVMEELRGLDQVAYVRFASVYRSFQDVQEFRDEIERLQRELPPESRKHQIPLLPDDS